MCLLHEHQSLSALVIGAGVGCKQYLGGHEALGKIS